MSWWYRKKKLMIPIVGDVRYMTPIDCSGPRESNEGVRIVEVNSSEVKFKKTIGSIYLY